MVLILTNIHTRSTVGSNHEIFQFVQVHCLSGTSCYGVVQHLTCSIGVLDLVSGHCLEEQVRVLRKVDWRHEICRCCQENTHDAGMYETETDGTSYAAQDWPCACHLTGLFLDLAKGHDVAVTELHSNASLIWCPVRPDKDRVSILDPSRPYGQAQITTSTRLLRRLCGIVNVRYVDLENSRRLLEVLRNLLDLHEMVDIDVD